MSKDTRGPCGGLELSEEPFAPPHEGTRCRSFLLAALLFRGFRGFRGFRAFRGLRRVRGLRPLESARVVVRDVDFSLAVQIENGRSGASERP